MFAWRSDVGSLHLWSTQRRIISFEQFAAGMEQLLQECVLFLITERTTGNAVGFVHTYGASPEDGFTHFLLFADEDVRGTGLVVEAAILFGEYLFTFFALRKLYAEVYEFNQFSIATLESAGFTREGVLREHLWFRDRYWDMYQYALYRKDWRVSANECRRCSTVAARTHARGGPRAATCHKGNFLRNAACTRLDFMISAGKSK